MSLKIGTLQFNAAGIACVCIFENDEIADGNSYD
jgi:hypothetical protein